MEHQSRRFLPGSVITVQFTAYGKNSARVNMEIEIKTRNTVTHF